MRDWLKSAGVAILALAVAAVSVDATGSANYGFDPDGRLTTAHYDNGICTVYAYDENGNRTSQTNPTGSTTAQWGTGYWGCFSWTAP